MFILDGSPISPNKCNMARKYAILFLMMIRLWYLSVNITATLTDHWTVHLALAIWLIPSDYRKLIHAVEDGDLEKIILNNSNPVMPVRTEDVISVSPLSCQTPTAEDFCHQRAKIWPINKNQGTLLLIGALLILYIFCRRQCKTFSFS